MTVLGSSSSSSEDGAVAVIGLGVDFEDEAAVEVVFPLFAAKVSAAVKVL